MLERLKYKNHMNEVFDFGVNGIYVNSGDLHDYSWKATTKGNRVSALDRTVVSKKLPVIIMCETEEQGIEARNRLMEVTEKDVLAMKHGRIMIGDYYFRCYVTASKKKDYMTTKRFMHVDLTLTSDFPYWVKETKYTFLKTNEVSGGKNLDFAHDHPYDYFSGMGIKAFYNTDFVATNFRMTIYGACFAPAVYVSGHLYQVDCEVGLDEYLTIDSVSKKITLTAVDGTVTNVFNMRNRDSYIFEKIAPGNNVVTWDGEFGVDITLLEERSEPKWT